jgi:L-alanine-DL-glutamate epimerase-like enolase superfamily enzyme
VHAAIVLSPARGGNPISRPAATETARELERLNCLWLEEPRLRYAFDELAELNRQVGIPIADGQTEV